MKNFLKIIISTTSLLIATVVLAQSVPDNLDQSFRQLFEVQNIDIKVPTVVEVPINSLFFERSDFAVLNKTTNQYQQYYITRTGRSIPITATAESSMSQNANLAFDNNLESSAEFNLPIDTKGQAEINLILNGKHTLNGLTLLLDKYVSLPTTIAVYDGEKIIYSPTKMDSTTVRWPAVSSSQLKVVLTYGQPLRISEIKLLEEQSTAADLQSIRFLAQPENDYIVYLDSDRYVKPISGDSDLSSNQDVKFLTVPTIVKNPTYKASDIDQDGIIDIADNCVNKPNPDQADINNNNRGDSCDDFDRDGIINTEDNCPNIPNKDQADIDGDKIGDSCDNEESRVTEKYPWLPWAGIVFAASVLATLLALSISKKK